MSAGTSYDDLYRLRALDDADAIERGQAGDNSPCGSQSMLVRTTTETTYPTSATKFYACNPVLITGAETEGSPGTLSVDTGTKIYAYNLGSAIPASGTDLDITFVRDRWVFRYD